MTSIARPKSREDSPSRYPQHYRRQDALEGYTGYFPPSDHEDIHELDLHTEKYMIRGYTGFRPFRRSAVGEPRIPNEEKQVAIRKEGLSRPPSRQTISRQSSGPIEGNNEVSLWKCTNPSTVWLSEQRRYPNLLCTQNFRSFGRYMDRMER